jgi:hypothetical protein
MQDLAEDSHPWALVILGDIRHSRMIADRSLVQSGLRQAAARTNSEKPSLLEVPFSISGGDEIQGLVSDPTTMVEVIDCLDLNSSIFDFRFGLGWGTVATPRAARTWEMDGECFHHAREAITRGKKEDRWISVVGFGEDGDQILDAIFRLMQVIREGWTKKQRLAVATRKTNDTQTATAEEMGLDDSTLSKMLKAAHFKQLVEMEKTMPELIRRLLGTDR